MATEREIREAERARLEGIVAEHGSEREKFQLVLSGVMRAGVTLAQLEGTEPVGYLPPEPELLARLARRAARRAKLGLPAVECGRDPPTSHGCSCLERALDESGDGGKRAVLKLAADFHWSPPRRTEPARPTEQPAPLQEAEQEPPAPAESRPPASPVANGQKFHPEIEKVTDGTPTVTEPVSQASTKGFGARKREPVDPRAWRSQRSREAGSEAVRAAHKTF
jgi:hypothetical protein